MRDLRGRITLVGGTDEDRRQAREWAGQFLGTARGLDGDRHRA
jgi:hypothetical protein